MEIKLSHFKQIERPKSIVLKLMEHNQTNPVFEG